MRRKERTDGRYYLVCERNWIYFLLIGVAGIFGAYTYLERGGVFCNAQTVNVVLMGMALGTGNWGRALYYIVPVTAYVAGAFVSELVPGPVKRRLSVRWDTLLILVELLAVAALGLVPDAAPVSVMHKIPSAPAAAAFLKAASNAPGAGQALLGSSG